MRNRTTIGVSLIGFALTAIACATPPASEGTSRMWVSTGGELTDFADAERHCIEQATPEVDAAVDEALFVNCMYSRGWRDSSLEVADLGVVLPRDGVRSGVNVRTAPSTTSTVLSGLAAGEQAQLLGREGDWYRVRLSDGQEGYVSARWTQTR